MAGRSACGSVGPVPHPDPSEERAVSASPDLVWLDRALFDSATLRPGSRNQELTWARLPVRGTTRRLVPVEAKFAAEAFTNRHDAMSKQRLAAGRITRRLVGTGGLRFGPTISADPERVLADRDHSAIAAAAHGAGLQVAGCAITLGPRRFNRKPVVQLIDDRAQTVGFVKVGADDATSAMVRHEASMLNRFRSADHELLAVPQILWEGSFDNRPVMCVSPVGRTGRLAAANADRLNRVARAVVEVSGGSENVDASTSSPVHRLQAEATAHGRTDVVELVEHVETSLVGRPASMAGWHGDFSPWNMISTDAQTALIDWEFAGDAMPVGADLLHNRVMVATHLDGEPIDAPLGRFVASADNLSELAAMGVPSDQHQAHLVLYLLELIRRDTGFADAAATSVRQLLPGMTKP